MRSKIRTQSNEIRGDSHTNEYDTSSDSEAEEQQNEQRYNLRDRRVWARYYGTYCASVILF